MNMFQRFALSGATALSLVSVSFGQHYTQTNLQANVPGVAEAADPQLVNYWGLARPMAAQPNSCSRRSTSRFHLCHA
jgi:hypothetical protein